MSQRSRKKSVTSIRTKPAAMQCFQHLSVIDSPTSFNIAACANTVMIVSMMHALDHGSIGRDGDLFILNIKSKSTGALK